MRTQGVVMEPGLRAAIDSALSTSLAQRGVPVGGPALHVELLDESSRAEAAAATAEARAVVRESSLALRLRIEGRPGCVIEVRGRTSVPLPPAEPLASTQAHADAMQGLAVELADRAVDALIGDPQCR